MKLTIGEKIALLRKEKGVTQTELAEYLVLAPQTVSRWEAGGGAPEITLLPKIAAFFGVSIDELFGVTSIERAENLVCKYSVLRDDRSFQEAMECLNSQLQTIDAALSSGAEDPAGLEEQRDRLEAEKMHLWIQQGREAFQRALAAAESFVEKTQGKPEHPWYVRMRLQRNQLYGGTGKGREALAACKKEFAEHPDETTLYFYVSLLDDLERYEELLSIREERQVKEVILPPSRKNLPVWRRIIHAAAELGEGDLIQRSMPDVLAVCDGEDEFGFLMCLLDLYRKENREEKLAETKRRLLALLPGLPLNEYFEEAARQRIGEA